MFNLRVISQAEGPSLVACSRLLFLRTSSYILYSQSEGSYAIVKGGGTRGEEVDGNPSESFQWWSFCFRGVG
jgi:hypothetical protein